MITHLAIKNYALIAALSIDFSDGLTTITGETGSGKSILLGALGLVLGNRADLSVLSNKDSKCVIEATFHIAAYKLQSFFTKNDLDYEADTIIRREILPSGKSRAFINDTPITLNVLSQLGKRLIDIHSQHQTLALSSKEFQFQLIDALANNDKYLNSYSRGLKALKEAQKALDNLLEEQKTAQASYDYNLHLFTELENAKLIAEEQETLEERLQFLENIDTIKLQLSESFSLIETEEIGLQAQLFLLKNKLEKLSNLSDKYQALNERISAVNIEFLDISSEIGLALEKVDFDPSELEKTTSRLQLIYDLQQKHNVNSITDLLEKQKELEVKVAIVNDASSLLKEKEQTVADISSKLEELSQTIHQRREVVLPKLTKQLEAILSKLGMKHARFDIGLTYQKNFNTNGKDELSFLFTANKGAAFGELKKVASGGELSRIMLAVKTVLSKYKKLPTLIFDEIDTGVSGEVAGQIAQIMQEMSKNMQLMAITHLPQIAAKGKEQLMVSKKTTTTATHTNIVKLSQEQRIDVIAAMISGATVSDAAKAHAKSLLLN